MTESEETMEKQDKVTENEIDDFFVKLEEALMSGNNQSKTEALESLRSNLNENEDKGLKTVGKLFEKCAYPEIKALVTERIKAQVTRCVTEEPKEVLSLLDFSKNDVDHKQSLSIICEAFETLQPEILKKLLCDIIIPGIFDTTLGDNVHNTVIDVGFLLIKLYPITNLSGQEAKTFISDVIKQHSEVLEKLREQNYARWSDLWIFLIRFSAKHLHNSMDLTNKLLRVVEFAFRNPSYEQRLKGYDCWKELIDNASLDMNRMCSNKQIKLLITPLRAKFSKMVVVICKRFEVFLYLIEKLQNHSVLCLNEFLEFCFGVSRNNSNATKNGQGKLVPELWLKIIHVFLAILGDQTHISASMNKTLFDGSVINENNIDKFDQVIVYSMIESSIMLKKLTINSQDKITLMSSLWEALFNILEKSSPEIQEQCFQLIFRSLGTIFKEFNEDITYIGLSSAFGQALESSIDHRLLSDSLKLFLEYCLKFLSEKDVSSEFFQQFCDLIQISCKQVQIVDFFVEQLKKLEPSKNESKIYKIWNIVGSKLTDNFSNSSKTVLQFFLWPVHHLQKFGGQLLTDICSVWIKLLIKAAKSSRILKKNIINELDKSFKSNPLLGSSIVSLISEISQKDVELDKEFVRALFKLMANLVCLPLLPQESSEKLSPLILKITTFTVQMQEIVDMEFLNDVCQCVDKLPGHQKNKILVDVLEKLIKKMNNSPAEKKIKDLLASFPDPTAHKPSLSSLSPLDQNNEQVLNTSKRSVRMTQMVIDSTSPNANKNKITALQIFGKDIDTMSPLKVKGSMLNTTPNSRSKKIVNSVKKKPEPPMIEDQTCDFVVIDTEVNVQKDKLTEHQKEEFKRRREDIPALYQDLSQSHSQSESLSNLPNSKIKNGENDIENNTPNGSGSVDEASTSTSRTTNASENNGGSDVERKRSVRRRELNRIRMDLVGGNSFLSNLPSKRHRKSTSILEKMQENEQENEVQEHEQSENHISPTPVTIKPEEEVKIEQGPTEIVPVGESTPSKIDTKLTSNNRKNKLVKPKKHTDTPKRRVKQEDGTAKKPKERTVIKVKPPVPTITRKREVSPRKNNSDQIQSETMFDSQPEAEPKKRKSKKTEHNDSKELNVSKDGDSQQSHSQPEAEPKKRKSLKKTEHNDSKDGDSQQSHSQLEGEPKKRKSSKKTEHNDSKESNVSKDGDSQQSQGQKTGKLKGRQKDIMKKSKEKFRTIQSQLQLANLSDISVSSEPKKPKGAKLIFIREITNSKNDQDTKVTPAGVKRNKDKKSSNIAYTIETPAELVSLDLDLQSTSMTPDEPVRGRKRRRDSNSNDSGTEEAPEKVTKRRSKEKTPKETDVKQTQSPKSTLLKKLEPPTGPNDTTQKIIPAKIPTSPDSSARVTRSRTSSLSPISMPKKKSDPIKNIKHLFESEDIIESSQSSQEDNATIANLIKSKIKPVLKTGKNPDDIEDSSEPDTPEIKTSEQNQPISLPDTLTCDSNNVTIPNVLNVDLPEKPELTDSEKILSSASTASIEEISIIEEKIEITPEKHEEKDDDKDKIEAIEPMSPVPSSMESLPHETPQKSDDLPGSPINNVTPTLTKEFLDNTLDISPIPQEFDDLEEKHDNDILKKLDAAIEDCGLVTKETNGTRATNDKPAKVGLSLNLRSNKLLNMVNVGTPVTHKTGSLKRIISSPSLAKSRNDKLFSIFNGMKDEEKEEQKEDCASDFPAPNHEDMLTFSREVPSPFAVPSSSIMKRKLADTDDNFSPAAKRKRVNFSYPCITSVKHFVRHQEEINKSYKPSFPQNLFDIFDEEDSEDDDPFADPKPEQPETEESMEITDPSLLSKNDSFYPLLIECKDSLKELSNKLASPKYSNTLRKVLGTKNINTIGDLARLSELDIKRLPFKQPRLKVVRKTLDEYFANVYKKPENLECNTDSSSNDSDEAANNDTNIENNQMIVAPIRDAQNDVSEEFKKALKRLKDEGIALENLGPTFLDFVDESEIIVLLKNVYNTDVKKFFEKSHWRYLIESIVQTGGTSEMFDIISDLAENNKTFADQLESIVQLRIKENPLKDILQNKTLVELNTALQSCIDTDVFRRSDVLQTCLMPLIKNPNDFKVYFNNLTIVEVYDLFIERVQPSDLTVFLEQITEHYGDYTMAQSVKRTNVLKICSKEELVDSLVEKDNVVEAVKGLISKIGDQSKIVELFKFITNLVPVKNRIDSYIEFLQSIQNDK